MSNGIDLDELIFIALEDFTIFMNKKKAGPAADGALRTAERLAKIRRNISEARLADAERENISTERKDSKNA